MFLSFEPVAGVAADEVIPDPPGGAHADWEAAAATVKEAVLTHLKDLSALKPDQLLKKRWAKFEAMGAWREADEEG